MTAPNEAGDAPPPPPDQTCEPRLPPDWKSAKDDQGRTYYYHRVTRQTQWARPTAAEGTPAEMELDTPPSDSKKSKSKHKVSVIPSSLLLLHGVNSWIYAVQVETLKCSLVQTRLLSAVLGG